MDNDICLYGVFDGNDGSRVSAFAAQNMPAEILLGQLGNRNSDEDMKEVLRQVLK
jgi:TAK1-binding protein 1